jgi:hypothetical protein
VKCTRVRIAVVAALFAGMIASTVPAVAATQLAPLTSLSMQVQRTNSVLLVSAQVASSVKLPATVGLPVPKGAKPYWVGEVLGGDPSKDPKAQYTTRKAKGYDLIVFEITQARLAQVEVSLPASAPAGVPATLSYSLPIASSVDRAALVFQLPAGTIVSSSTAGLVVTQDASGGQVLTKVVNSPKRGTAVKGSVSYTVANAPTAAPLAPSSDSADVLVVPLWILAIGLAGLFGKTVLDRRAAARAEVADDEEPAADTDERPASSGGTSKAPAGRSRKASAGPVETPAKRTRKAPANHDAKTSSKRSDTARKAKPE